MFLPHGLVESDYQRTCDKCGKVYILNSEQIPRIIIKKKMMLSDLVAKDSYANPDFCADCVAKILLFLQTKNVLRFSLKNEQQNNTFFSNEENRILKALKRR